MLELRCGRRGIWSWLGVQRTNESFQEYSETSGLKGDDVKNKILGPEFSTIIKRLSRLEPPVWSACHKHLHGTYVIHGISKVNSY